MNQSKALVTLSEAPSWCVPFLSELPSQLFQLWLYCLSWIVQDVFFWIWFKFIRIVWHSLVLYSLNLIGSSCVFFCVPNNIELCCQVHRNICRRQLMQVFLLDPPNYQMVWIIPLDRPCGMWSLEFLYWEQGIPGSYCVGIDPYFSWEPVWRVFGSTVECFQCNLEREEPQVPSVWHFVAWTFGISFQACVGINQL